MTQQAVLDLIGYGASVLVAVSLMMTSVLRLRVINLMGAVAFAVYGVLIDAYPVAAVNLLIVGINVFHIRAMLTTREYFELLEVERDSKYLGAFLRFHRDQIQRFFPGFTPPPRPDLAIFVLRDLVPAGLVLAEREGDELRVRLDFVIPRYRDLKIGRYLFHDRCEYFAALGIRSVVAEGGTRAHARYLSKIGFVAAAESDRRDFRLRLRC